MRAVGLPPWEAVEKFSDPQLMREFRELRDVEGVLLEMTRIGWPPSNRGERVERYLVLQNQILGTFEADLAKGVYVATGYDVRANTRGQAIGRRRIIPLDLVDTLRINYQSATASGGGYLFSALRIRPKSRSDIAAITMCLKWLEEEKVKGYEPRTKLEMWKKVEQRFGQRITRYAFETLIWPQVAEEKWTHKGRKKGS